MAVGSTHTQKCATQLQLSFNPASHQSTQAPHAALPCTRAKALHALTRAPCQVYAQPVFQAIEDGFVALRPTLNFVTPKQALLLRFAYR